MTGYANTLTHTAGVTLTIGDATAGAGNVALEFPAAGWTYTLGSGTTSAISFISTSATQQTVNFANRVTGNITHSSTPGSSGSWIYTGGRQGSAAALFTIGTAIVDINGQTITGGTFSSNTTAVRSITLGSATITMSATTSWDFTVTTNLTFSGASATINMASTFHGGSQVYGTVVSTSAAMLLSGSNTFTVLTFNGTTTKTSNVRLITANGTQTIGTLTLAGNSILNRLLVSGNDVGTLATLNVTTIIASNVDFRDVIAAGSADWNLANITGKSGDCGGNTGITFTPAETQTATGTASFTWSTHGWTSRVPLCQDDVVINNAFIAGRTVTVDQPRMGKNINWTGATGTPAWTISTATTVYGSITKILGMTQGGVGIVTFENRSPATFSNAGVVWTNPLNIACFGTTLTLLDALTSSNTLTAKIGNFIDAGFATTFTTITSTGGLVRTLTRTGSMTLTGTGAVLTYTASGLTLAGAGSSITITEATQGTSKTFAGGGLTTFGALVLSGKNIIITGANTFASLALNNLDDTVGITFPANTTTTVTGAITSTAISGDEAKIISSISGTPATLSKASGIVSLDWISIKDSAFIGGANKYAGANSTNVSGNSGWIFSIPPTRIPSFWNFFTKRNFANDYEYLLASGE